MSWRADSLSCVMFYQSQVQPDALTPWMKAFGAPPQNLAPGAQNQPASTQASGDVGSYQAALISQMGRTDIIFNAKSLGSSGPSSIAEVDPALDALDLAFRKLISRDDVLRLAIIMNLSRVTPNVAESVELFKQETKLQLPQHSIDLTYGLNTPCDLDAVDQRINRVCRWSTGHQQLFNVQVPAPGMPPVVTASDYYAFVLTIDMNTPTRTDAFSMELANQTFGAMIAEAKLMHADAFGRMHNG